MAKATARIFRDDICALCRRLLLREQVHKCELDQAKTEEQQSAVYRRDLIHNFTPVVMQRKAFGWGITTYPEIDGQKWIDNQYLSLAVTQGFVRSGAVCGHPGGMGDQAAAVGLTAQCSPRTRAWFLPIWPC